MLYSKDSELEDRIVEILISGTKEVKSLHKIVNKTLKEPLTLRAIYKSVNKMLRAGVLLKIHKDVMIDREWLIRTQIQLNKINKTPILELGEKITYSLTSLSGIDVFWKTITPQIINTKLPICFWNHHDFWIYLPDRKKSGEKYYKSFAKDKRYAYFTIGGSTELDMDFKKAHQSSHLLIDINKKDLFKITDHITVDGDYIITVRLPKYLANEIHTIYRMNSSYSIEEKIVPLIKQKHKVKVILERNNKKAHQLRSNLSKNFV